MMKTRDRLMQMPTSRIVAPLPRELGLLDGSDHIDFCIEVFEKADQPALFQALNGAGVGIPGTGYTLRIDKASRSMVVGQTHGQGPMFPPDWLERIHSTAGPGTIIWLGAVCAAKKPELAAQVQADIANYTRLPGGWRRR
jgi:hypothetical protein